MDFSLAAIHKHWCKRNGGATLMVCGGWLNTGRLRRRTAYALPVPYSRTGYGDIAVDASWPNVDAEWGCAKRGAQPTSSQVQLDAGKHPKTFAKTPTHNESSVVHPVQKIACRRLWPEIAPIASGVKDDSSAIQISRHTL